MSSNVAAANYRQPGQQGGSPRETEGRALLESARRMATAQQSANPKEDIRDAVRLNWRLWTIFQSELSTPNSELPEPLRVNMLTLCNFVDKRTVAVIATPKPELIDVLVNINKNVAAGLLADTAPQAPAGQTPAAQPMQPSLAGGLSA